MLKHLFLFLGSLIIGFGIGLITGKYFALTFSSLWLLIIISLIGGGFLLALSLRRTAKPKPIENKKKIENKERQSLENQKVKNNN